MKIREIALGPEDSLTATSYNYIGGIYSAINEFDKALKYLNKALQIRERKLGVEDLDTATTYNNIGTVHFGL